MITGFLSLSAMALTAPALGATLDLTQPGVVAPSLRGGPATTWFGWDSFDGTDTPAPAGFGKILDDATPDLGTYAGTDARIVQDASLTFGHRSASDSYYTGFRPIDVAGDTITVPTDGSVGATGFTTIVLQLFALGGGGGAPPGTPGVDNAILGFEFDPIAGVSPDVFYATDEGVAAEGKGHYLVVYELPGNEATYDLRFSSTRSSRALDLIIVDTLYAETAGAFDDVVVVPEPATAGALGALACVALRRRRRSR